MKKNKNSRKFKYSPLMTILLAVLAVCLILFGSIGGTRAVLTYSGTYTGTMETQSIGVELRENESEKAVSGEELLVGLLAENEKLQPGRQYDEKLTVANTGDIDQYVRLTLTRYWTDKNGKRVDLSPEYIKLVFSDSENWLQAEAAKTDERVILYYKLPLKTGETTDAALEKVAADSAISSLVINTEENGKLAYQYDGLELNLEASVDAIQTHHAQEAILSSWGVEVTIDEATGQLSLMD